MEYFRDLDDRVVCPERSFFQESDVVKTTATDPCQALAEATIFASSSDQRDAWLQTTGEALL